jgi:peptide/nickel transport system substrate-binding protein
MSEMQRRAGAFRRRRNVIENHIIDEYVAGRIDRKEFMRRGTVAGLSLPAISFLIAACGGSDSNDAGGSTAASETNTGAGTVSAGTTAAPAKAGGTLRIAGIKPSTASANADPVAVNDGGGLGILSQVGQFLCVSAGDLSLRPSIASSWTSNADATEWTFTLDPAATFSDGSPITAADVVATIERLVNPDNTSNALSAFNTGNLGPGGTTAVDDKTVKFTLSAPMGSFPYIVSSDNYNSIILPASVTDTTRFGPDKIVASGPWIIEEYDPVTGVTFIPNPNYWGTPVAFEKQVLTFFADTASEVQAFQGGQVDAIVTFSVQQGQALLSDPNTTVIELKAATHRQVHLRCDKGPFADKRVRQALAMSLDRAAIIQGLFQGRASLGNDSPFAPVFPTTDPSVPQREIDLDKAKALMAEAGVTEITTEIHTWQNEEMPDYAALIKTAGEQLGITLDIQVRDDYYEKYWLPGDGAPGSDIGITDYGHRGVPNVYLNAALKSPDKGGVWNASQFANETYDGLVDEYAANPDIQGQKATAKKIQELLLDETPIVFSYFYNYLSATTTKVTGVETTAMGHFYTEKGSFTE